MTSNQELIRLKDMYKNDTGNADIDIHAFVAWLKRKGYPMPQPPTPEQVMAKKVVKALKEETREDPETGEVYKVNYAFATDESGNGVLWTDIDEAPRRKVVKVAAQRRNQIVADAVQLDLLTYRWNRRNPNEEPIVMDFDLGFDVELARMEREEPAPV